MHTDDAIMRATARLRAVHMSTRPKLRLPDAIISATAIVNHRVIVTRDVKGFRDVRVHVPYQIKNGHVCERAAPLE